MGKYNNEDMNMFDNVEQPTNEKAEDTRMPQDNGAPAESEQTFSMDYLEKVLQIQRNFSSQQQESKKIMQALNGLVKRLENCKDIRVGLSEDDKNMLSALPITINEQVANTVGQAGERVKADIDKHTNSTMKTVSRACDRKTEEVMRVMNSGKGIYISWWNFWAMIILTAISVSYATFNAIAQCKWGEIWEDIWFPFTTIVVFAAIFGLIFYLNYREY